MILRSDPTHYTVWHEMFHYLHYKQIGPEAYAALPRRPGFNAAEQHVFDQLENNRKRWEALTDEEREHAIDYIEAAGDLTKAIGFR